MDSGENDIHEGQPAPTLPLDSWLKPVMLGAIQLPLFMSRQKDWVLYSMHTRLQGRTFLYSDLWTKL